MDLMALVNLVHIVSGIFWAGGAFMIAWFITPTVKATGSEGQAFMRGLAQGTRLSLFMTVSSWLAVISGLYMSWIFSGGFDIGWIMSAKGLALTVGGLVAVVALVIGMVVQRPSSDRIAELGREIQAGSGPPTPEQAEEMQALQEKITAGGKWVAILLVISIVGMALGRWMF